MSQQILRGENDTAGIDDNVLDIKARGDKDGIALISSVNSSLNSGVLRWNIDNCRGSLRRHKQDNDAADRLY